MTEYHLLSIHFNSISVNSNDFKTSKRIGRLECLRYLEAQKDTRKKMTLRCLHFPLLGDGSSSSPWE